jgi:hypothetical protein
MSFITAIYHHQYDHWILNHKVTFDGVTKTMFINSGVTEINVEIDLYSDWKEWVSLRDHTKFDFAMRNVGGDPLPGGQFLGGTFFLSNGWRILLDHGVNFTGNLYTDEGDSPFMVSNGVQLSTSTVSNLIDRIGVPTGTEIASDVRTELTVELANMDTTVSSRASQTSVDAVDILLNTVDGKVDIVTVDIGNILTMVDLINKFGKNRTKLDPTAFTLTIFDSDNTTILHVFDLKDENGIGTVSRIFERIPQ